MKQITLGCTSLCMALATPVLADTPPKQALLANYQLNYQENASKANTFVEMFTQGDFFARLRSNTFYYAWEKQTSTQDTHLISGLGASLVYKSAAYAGFDFTLGGYASYAFFDDASDPVALLKPGKDVLSRYDYFHDKSAAMAVLGQAYLRYGGIDQTAIAVGRQIVETFYTKSNDTKMIPNTFDGVVVTNKSVPQTAVKLAYLTQQKLRDHTTAHGVLVYDDTNTAQKSTWNGNDDSAMHVGLKHTALVAAGKDPDAPLITGDIRNESIENLTLEGAFYTVPELLSEAMIEANYKTVLHTWTLTPGMRYIKQFDHGAGSVGGAAYDGTTTGYKDPNSLASQMIAARVVAKHKKHTFNLGYSAVADAADLIAPWRGFPTAGYTRSMARYNWVANTKSYRLEYMLNSNKTGVYKEMMVQLSALYTDADEAKGQFDETYYYAGFVQNIPSIEALQWRLRIGYADTQKAGADNLDGRFELNYLF